MDRRSLLAIVLSVLVILAFNFFLQPKRPVQPPLTSAADSLRAADSRTNVVPSDNSGLTGSTSAFTAAFTAADSSAARVSPFDAGFRPDLQPAATMIPVAIDGVEAVFTTGGGAIESWRLIRFPAPGGQVEMVRTGPEPHAVLHLGDREIDLNIPTYTSSLESIDGGGQLLTFRAGEPGGLQVVKRYRLTPQSPLYQFEIELSGLPISSGDSWLEVGWAGGLPHAEPVKETDRTAFGAVVAVGKDVQRIGAGSFKKENRKEVPGQIHWVAARNKYFMAALVPPPSTVTSAIAVGNASEHVAGSLLHLPISGAGEFRQSLQLYLGPIDYWQLKTLGLGLEYAVDLGWKIILPVAQLLLWALNAGYKIIPNYGLVIILLSGLTRLLFYPLTAISMRSMKAMQEIQPEMEKLRKKYEKDPQELNKRVFQLYRDHKVNPVSGCLPMLLQMPVFFALYSVLANSVGLRQAPFVGWITDLSAPDTLMTIGGFAIHVLPVLMSLSMFWQQKLTPTDPRQAPIMLLMPFMMLFFFYKVPSGLTLYWTVTNLFSVAQQYQMNRENKTRAAVVKTG